MTKTQKFIGSSALSLLLLAVTMFAMCGVRMQKINSGDDFALLDENDSEYQDDLLNQLEVMDGEGEDGDLFADGEMNGVNGDANNSNSGDDGWGDDGWGDDGWGDDGWGDSASNEDTRYAGNDDAMSMDDGSDFMMTDNASDAEAATGADDAWITPELMESLQKEIEDLERIASAKQRTADSLRMMDGDSQYADAAFNTSQPANDNTLTEPLPLPDSSPGYDASYSSAVADATFRSTSDSYYDTARDAFLSRNYSSAIQQFREMLIRGSAGNLADNCQYWIGESYFAKGEYYKAIVEFEKVNAFPRSNKAVDAQLMLGLALMKAGETKQALNEFASLVKFFPGKAAAQKAQRYLDDLMRA